MRELTEKIAIEGKSIVKDFQLGDTRTRVLKSISLKVSQVPCFIFLVVLIRLQVELSF